MPKPTIDIKEKTLNEKSMNQANWPKTKAHKQYLQQFIYKWMIKHVNSYVDFFFTNSNTPFLYTKKKHLEHRTFFLKNKKNNTSD